MERLNDRVVIVTGGAQGLGEGIVRRLLRDGARVVIADRNGEKARSLAAELSADGTRALGVAVDVAERNQVQAMIAQTSEAFGGIDVLFNNAGFNKPLPFFDADEADYNSIMRVNALAVL